MTVAELSSPERQRLELAGVAEAWLRKPLGYPREMRALLKLLDDDETPQKAFFASCGKTLPRAGLVLLTDARAIYVSRRAFPRRIVATFDLDTVVGTKLEGRSTRLPQLKVTTQGGEYYFWNIRANLEDLERLQEALRSSGPP